MAHDLSHQTENGTLSLEYDAPPLPLTVGVGVPPNLPFVVSFSRRRTCHLSEIGSSTIPFHGEPEVKRRCSFVRC